MSTAAAARSHSQTLDRGIVLLDLLARAERPLSLAELVEQADFARTIVHRLLTTFARRGMVRVRADKRYELSLGLFVFGNRSVGHTLASRARPALEAIAEEFECSALLGVVHDDTVVILATAASARARVQAHLREGEQIALGTGACGLAALAALAAPPDERPSVARTRRLGFAVSHAAIAAGSVASAAPLHLDDMGLVGTVTLVFGETDSPTALQAGEMARAAGARLQARLAPEATAARPGRHARQGSSISRRS
ncbi:MAG: helix-turn-helix domain-containing protein [Actinobacteria bacterium]|nr:helix-turn-helix domain-containing protein [Actinomycetota bacterium]